MLPAIVSPVVDDGYGGEVDLYGVEGVASVQIDENAEAGGIFGEDQVRSANSAVSPFGIQAGNGRLLP